MAQQMHRTYAKESYHYILDEKFIYRLVPDDYQAMFAPDTKNTIGILLCDDPSALNSRWEDSQHTSMLAMLADLVAKLCLAYGIKPRLLKSDELSRWKKWRVKRRGGIVANGFLAQTYWPQDYFLTLVKANIEKYKLITK